eukprot:Selendium_serpulae@DN6109_c1_g1_i2.p1
MKYIQSSIVVEVPDEVNLTIAARVVRVENKANKDNALQRSFKHLPVDMRYSKEHKKIMITMWLATSKSKCCLRTVASHIRNMFTGVLKKYQYKMRLVYAHFPINATIKDGKPQTLEIRNFLGSKLMRHVVMQPNVHIARSSVKDELILTSCDLEALGRSCAQVKQSALVRNKDIRKFLDGIYVYEKGTVLTDEY